MPVTRKAWTRAERLVALNLYHTLAFGQWPPYGVGDGIVAGKGRIAL